MKNFIAATWFLVFVALVGIPVLKLWERDMLSSDPTPAVQISMPEPARSDAPLSEKLAFVFAFSCGAIAAFATGVAYAVERHDRREARFTPMRKVGRRSVPIALP